MQHFHWHLWPEFCQVQGKLRNVVFIGGAASNWGFVIKKEEANGCWMGS